MYCLKGIYLFPFLYRWEYDLSGCISPGRHQWDGRGSSPAGANAITYTYIQKQAQEKNTLLWFGLKDGKWKMQSKLVLSLRGVDVYSSPMSFVRGSAAITNPGLAGHAYLGSVNPSPLLAHSHINTSIHPLHTSHFVLEFLFFLLWMNKHFCSKIIRCFYEQKLHIYILNVLQCVLSEPKNNSCSRFCSVQTSIE